MNTAHNQECTHMNITTCMTILRPQWPPLSIGRASAVMYVYMCIQTYIFICVICVTTLYDTHRLSV